MLRRIFGKFPNRATLSRGRKVRAHRSSSRFSRRGLSVRGSVILSLALAVLGICPAQQFDSASVSGIVVDSNQQPIDEVEVQLLDDKSGRILTGHTDLTGRYAFSDLRSGRYSLTFLHPEYAARSLPRFELLLGSPLQIPVKLDRLGPPLTRPRAGIETIALEYGMVREQIAGVPILLGAEGRTAVDKLSLLVPGLTPVAAQEIDPLTGRAAAVSANGSRQSAINYQLDGASNNAQNRLTGAQVGTFAPAPEALETFRVVSHTYSAREGRNAGAIVSPLTRRGESSFHGQARGFWRPPQGDLETFGGGSNSIKGRAAGGQIGGPLSKKRKLYIFLDAEGWKTGRRSTQIADVLAAAERSGDLSQLTDRPIDPSTRVPFPDGIIPADRLDPLMQTYLDAFVPRANLGEDRYRFDQDLASSGQILLGPSRLLVLELVAQRQPPIASERRALSAQRHPYCIARNNLPAPTAIQQRPDHADPDPDFEPDAFDASFGPASRHQPLARASRIPQHDGRSVRFRLCQLRARDRYNPRRHPVGRRRLPALANHAVPPIGGLGPNKPSGSA